MFEPFQIEDFIAQAQASDIEILTQSIAREEMAR